MARVEIPVSRILRSGLAPPTVVAGDPTNDHVIRANDGRIFLEAQNTGASAQTVTVQTPGTVADLAIADLTVVVPAGATRLVGPFPTTVFNQTGTSDVYVDVSETTWSFRAYKL